MSGGSGGDAYLDDREREVEEHDAQRQQVRLVAAVRGSQRGSGGAHHAMLRAPRRHDDRLAASPGEGGVFLEVDALRARGVRRGGGTHRLRQEGELLCAAWRRVRGGRHTFMRKGKGARKSPIFICLADVALAVSAGVCHVPRATQCVSLAHALPDLSLGVAAALELRHREGRAQVREDLLRLAEVDLLDGLAQTVLHVLDHLAHVDLRAGHGRVRRGARGRDGTSKKSVAKEKLGVKKRKETTQQSESRKQRAESKGRA